MRRSLQQELLVDELRDKTVNEQWDIISSKIKEVVDRHIPHRKFTGKGTKHRRPIWMNERVLSRLKRKKSAFDRYRETRDGKDYLEYCKGRNVTKAERPEKLCATTKKK
jgi:hypothetical protein